MTTQQKREFILTLTLEKDKIAKFIESIPAKKFVRLHQRCFKDHYLREPAFLGNAEFLDEICIWDTISEKYRDFFNELGIDKACEWLGSDAPREYVEYEMGLGVELDEEDQEYSYDMFAELYGTTWSGWGYDAFICEVIESYYEHMNDEQTEGEYILND